MNRFSDMVLGATQSVMAVYMFGTDSADAFKIAKQDATEAYNRCLRGGGTQLQAATSSAAKWVKVAVVEEFKACVTLAGGIIVAGVFSYINFF